MVRQGPATAEEQAELQALRDQADRTGREASETVAALADKLAETTDPRTWARRTAAEAGAAAWQAAGQAVRARLRSGAGWPRLAAIAGIPAAIVVLTAAAMAWQRRRTS